MIRFTHNPPADSCCFFLTWLEFLPWPLGLDDLNIFYLSAFVSPNIQQLWSMAELQFSGSRRDLAVEKWVQHHCAGVCVGGKGGGAIDGGNRKKEESQFGFKNEWENG